MNVSKVMSRDVKIASPDDALQDAARMMQDIDAGALPVGENDRLVGMLTDRDITVRAVAQGKAPDTTKVRDVMTTDVKYMYEDETIEDAARNMSQLQVRRLPVLSRDKRLVGIVSLGDVANRQSRAAASALKNISQPDRPAT